MSDSTFSRYFKGDKIIWMIILCLFIVSILTVYSSIGMLAFRFKGGNTLFYLIRHSSFLFFGLVLTWIVHKMNYQVFSKVSQTLVRVAFVLLIATLALGVSRNEASRWITVPGLGIQFQSSDFAKFALIMYVAKVLAFYQDKSSEEFEKAFKKIITHIGAICVLILPENFSTSFLLFLTCFILLIIGRMPKKYIFRGLGLAVAGLGIFILLVLITPYRGRLQTWINRIENYGGGDKNNDSNFQVDQAKIAIVTGGFLGKGPGNSTQRNRIPHPYSDFIYAIIIEEYGLWGGVGMIFLYLFLFFRTGVIVSKCQTAFPALLAIGLTLIMVLQAMINMAVAVNLIPVTGQPLPFVSMGGTSILFSSIALGVILSISRNVEKNKKDIAMSPGGDTD